ncbi:MAG: DUF1569 domain-containing protein [Pirellulaceae bacterium]
MKPAQRRELKFSDFDEIVTDIHRLQENGYTSVGKWNLGQACSHLNDWMRYPMDGFPKPQFPFSFLLWGFRNTIGPSQLRKYIAAGAMPAGAPTDPRTVPPPDTSNDAEQVEKLCQTIERFKAFEGPLHTSLAFGPMDLQTGRQLQMMHAALHLSFLIPNDVTDANGATRQSSHPTQSA